MSVYTEDWPDALADIAEAGAVVTFSKTTPGGYNSADGTFTTATTTTCAGKAIKTKSLPKKFEGTGMVVNDPVSLLFAPDTFGDEPTLGMQCTWSGTVRTLKWFDVLAPDGYTILVYAVVGL